METSNLCHCIDRPIKSPVLKSPTNNIWLHPNVNKYVTTRYMAMGIGCGLDKVNERRHRFNNSPVNAKKAQVQQFSSKCKDVRHGFNNSPVNAKKARVQQFSRVHVG